MVSICYIITEGGKAHTCQMQLQCKTHTRVHSHTHSTQTCVRERSHKHSRHFITGESGRNEPVQCICHKARARRRGNKSHVSYSNLVSELSDALWMAYVNLRHVSGISAFANISIKAHAFWITWDRWRKKERKERKKRLCKVPWISNSSISGEICLHSNLLLTLFLKNM